MSKIILVMGLSGSGKSYLSSQLHDTIPNSVHLNGDALRSSLCSDLDFSEKSRLEHARRIFWLAQLFVNQGFTVIIDIIAPLQKMRELINPDVIVWMNTKTSSQFQNTDAVFEKPNECIEIQNWDYKLEDILSKLTAYTRTQEEEFFEPKQPTALLIGRYQPFHQGHFELCRRAYEEVGAICIGVRSTHGLPNNPFGFESVKKFIIDYFNNSQLKWDTKTMKIIQLPNITDVVYGRDVGYKIRKIDLDQELEKVSATEIRKKFT